MNTINSFEPSEESENIICTLVKPTGSFDQGFHLGNYISIIKPIKDFLKRNSSTKIYLGLADAHALNECPDAALLQHNSNKMLKTLAAFFYKDIMDEKLILYKQSSIPETFELMFILSQFCSKGMLNRMHAYKARVDDNRAHFRDPDYKINMGIFTYPILMAVDILQFDTTLVPVGIDQVQHLEVAAEIARIANNFCNDSLFTIPKPFVQLETVLPGTNGMKMSKSYNNTIQIFEDESKLKKQIFSIATNSKNVGEAKFEDESDIIKLYKAFSSNEEYAELLSDLSSGIGWGEAKTLLFNTILSLRHSALTHYDTLTQESIDNILYVCNSQVRSAVYTKLQSVKKALGL